MISRRRFHRVFRQGIWRTVRSARQGAPWLADLRAELLSFPAGKHDDQVERSVLSVSCSTKSAPDRDRSRRR
jgi:hypothetical protein